jgi:HPt (histidine-containing phosphotransfer) domain-containing protein
MASPPLDLSFFHQLSGGDNSRVVRYLEMLQQSIPAALETLREAAEHGEWDLLQRTAHALKPQFAYAGMPDLKERYQQLENLAKSGNDAAAILELLAENERDAFQLVEALGTEIQRLKS